MVHTGALPAIKQAYQQLVQSAKMSSLGEMAGGIAHEINNPLAIIHGKAEQLKLRLKKGTVEPGELPDWEKQLSKIETTADRIAKIIHGLRSFSRSADADPMKEVKVSQILEDTLELCKERFRSHGIALKVSPSGEIAIECRPAQISQILMNLLGNAHDAVEDLAEKWVELNVSVSDGFVLIRVTDCGQGIPEQVAEKMMEPFFTTKGVGRGTGLGLSICKGLAEHHRGSLSYDRSSKHTCFVLKLPLKQSASAQAPDAKAC